MPPLGGGAVRTWAIIDCLRHEGYRVELVTSSPTQQCEEFEDRVDRLWVQQRISPARDVVVPFKSTVGASLRQLPRSTMSLVRRILSPQEKQPPLSGFSHKRSQGIEALAGKTAYRIRPLAAIATYAWMAPALDRMPPGTLRLLDTIDVQHTRAARAQGAGGTLSHLECTLEEELAELARADILLAIQAEEREELRKMIPGKRVLLAEHACNIPDSLPATTSNYDLLYVGNLYDPNVRGLRQFIELVWPKVHAALPQSKLLVCGRICGAFKEPVRGVSFEGLVPDLAAYYERAAIVVNPVTYGSGLKVKSVEALANGKCLVCTLAGIGGLGTPEELPLIVADIRDGMANEIVRLLRDGELRRDYEERALAYAKEHYDPVQVYRELLDALKLHAGQVGHSQDSAS